MNRLQSELQRLYLPRSQAHCADDEPPSVLIEPLDRVRAMVLELRRPASWEVLARVWRGVQSELELPAPAIAVSGIDGLQLWFSLAEPIGVAQAHGFLASLRSRFLPDIDASRIGLMPASEASVLRQDLHAPVVPARQQQTGNWSAFVAADLAPVFGDTPWLDIAPNEEGQAALLGRLEMIEPTALAAALKRLGPGMEQSPTTAVVATSVDAPLARAQPATAAADADPKRFLLQIMNDDSVALALRIEAAKALLQHANDHRPQPSD